MLLSGLLQKEPSRSMIYYVTNTDFSIKDKTKPSRIDNSNKATDDEQG